MKITNINIDNVLGVSRVDVALPTAVTLFAGDNYAGKSSVRETVKAALLGVSERVVKKKDFDQLVHDGQQAGAAAIDFDGGHALFTAPDGKQELRHSFTMDQWEPMALALPYCLDPESFAGASDDERRKLLFAITGASAKTADIVASLKARGLEDKRIETVTPLLRSGFPAAAKFAEERGREAKADWKAVTKETYGHVKAEAWVAPAPTAEVDPNAIGKLTTKVGILAAKISGEQTKLGAAEQKLKAWLAHKEDAEADRKIFTRLASLEKKLEHDNDELLKWSDQVKILEGQAGSGPRVGLVHDLAAWLLIATEYIHENSPGLECIGEAENAIAAYESQYGPIGAEGSPEAAEKLPGAIKSRDLMQNAVNNTRRDIEAAKAAGARLSATVERGSEEEVAGIETILQGYQQERDQVNAELSQLRAAALAASTATEATANARAHHQAAQQWQIAIDALSPAGIPAEILGKALDPVNQTLHYLSTTFGWADVAVDADMMITSDGRPYALQSESEKWRTDTIIAIAIAKHSGLKLVALDRFDVLNLAGRADLIDGIDVLAANGTLETALIFGTLKQAPNVSQFPHVTAFWVESGTIAGQDKEVKEAA